MRVTQVFFIAIFLFFVACGEYRIETNMSQEVQDFEFYNQNNELFALEDLKGTLWIADFMYTNCYLVCPTMTANMARIQIKLKEENLTDKVEIISFSVDPDYDKPDVLKEYAESYQVDLSNWNFLTGYEFETIKDLSINSF